VYKVIANQIWIINALIR